MYPSPACWPEAQGLLPGRCPHGPMYTVAPQVTTMEGAHFCVPGMIDTHVHAPQYQFTGTATDLPLMQWLQAYTFPAERRCVRILG